MKKIELRFDTGGILGGFQGCYIARFWEDVGRWEAGATPAAAMGLLYHNHSEMFEGHGTEPQSNYPDFGAFIPTVPAGDFSPTRLGKLILEFPETYGVSLSIIEAERWPKPTERARNPFLSSL